MPAADHEIPCGYYTVSADGTVLEMNDSVLALLGRRREEVVNHLDIADLLMPESREKLARQLEATRAEGLAPAAEVDFLRRDGSVFPAVQVATLNPAEGGLQAVRFTVLDVGRLRQQETELRQTRGYLDNLFRSSNALILVLNSRGGVVRPNRGFENLSGYKQSELFGRPLQSLLPEEARDAAGSLLREAQEGGALEGKELPVLCKSGEIRTVVWNFSLLKSEAGQPPLFLAQGVDITDRKRADEQLRDSEEKFRQISASAQDAILMMDDRGRITYWNPAAQRIFGFAAEEVMGQALHSLIVPEPYRAAFEKGFATYLKTGEGPVIGRVLEVTALRQDGTPFPVELSISSTLLGGRRHAIGILRDITKRKQAEDALQHLNATLEQRVADEVAKNREKDHLLIQQSRLAAMGEMVHNIAHQWRQPLNALMLQLANLRDEYLYGELTPELLEENIASANRLIMRMSTTIDDFRDFFRPSREKKLFSLTRAVESAVQLIEASLHHDNVTVQCEWVDEVLAMGYTNEFSQVILNLLSNAKEALRAGGEVSIRVWREGEWGKVAVRDNGAGIPPEVMPKIFDPYFTTKDKGSGIGLYMSKKIVENMGGEIAAANVPAGGAEFVISLPAAAAGIDAE